MSYSPTRHNPGHESQRDRQSHEHRVGSSTSLGENDSFREGGVKVWRRDENEGGKEDERSTEEEGLAEKGYEG